MILRRGAVTGSSKPLMMLTGSDSQAPRSTPTQDQTVTTPPTHPRVITTACPPLLLTALARQLWCFHHCTLQVRESYPFISDKPFSYCLLFEDTWSNPFEYSEIVQVRHISSSVRQMSRISFRCLKKWPVSWFNLKRIAAVQLCFSLQANTHI